MLCCVPYPLVRAAYAQASSQQAESSEQARLENYGYGYYRHPGEQQQQPALQFGAIRAVALPIPTTIANTSTCTLRR